MTEYTLEYVLSEDGFYQIIQNRLDELAVIDVEDPEFQAIWCAADYRLKLYSTKKGKDDEIRRILDLFRKKGFVPQYNLCGPPTIRTSNAEMSPKGDLFYSVDKGIPSNGESTPSFTIIASGNAIPLTTISSGTCKWNDYAIAFSNNSRYVAISTSNKLEVWDVFNLKRIMSDDRITGASLLSWSKDCSRLSACNQDDVVIFNINTGHIISTDIKGRRSCIQLNDDGSALLALGENVIYYDIIGEKNILDIPVKTSNRPVVVWKNDAFIVLTNGRILSIDKSGVQIKSNLSEWVDTSDIWKNRAERYHSLHFKADQRWDMSHPMMSVVEGKVVYTCDLSSLDSSQKMTFDPVSLKVDRECIDPPLHNPENQMLDDLTIKKGFEEYPFINEQTYASDGKTFYRMKSESEIAGIQLHDNVRGIKAYIVKIFHVKPIPNSQSQYVNPGIMEKYGLDWFSEDLKFKDDVDDDVIYLTGDYFNSRFAIIDNEDVLELDSISLDHMFLQALKNPVWKKIEYEGKTTYIYFCPYGNTNAIYTCFNGEFKAKYFTNRIRSTKNPLFYVDGHKVLRYDPSTNSFHTVCELQEISANYSPTGIQEYGDIIAISVYGDGDHLYLVKDSRIIHEYTGIIDNQFCICEGRTFRQLDYEIIVDSIEDFGELGRIKILPEDQWCICGKDSEGNFGLIRYEHMSANEDNSISYDVRFARISTQDYKLDVFKEAKLHVECGIPPSHSLDFRKTRVVYIEYSDNPFRPCCVNSCNIKKDGIKQIYTLIADNSRFNLQIAPLEGDDYIIYADGNDEKNKKSMKPVMKVIDSSAGTTVKKYSDKTEGQLYGVEGFNISNMVGAFTLNNGRNVIAQFDRGSDHTVLSTDRYTGQKFPDKNGIHGVILSRTDRDVKIGLIEGEPQRTYEIKQFAEYDHTLKCTSPVESLNVPILSLGDSLRYPRVSGNSLELIDYSYEGTIFRKAVVTENVRIRENEWRLYEPIPLIIITGKAKEIDPSFPRPYKVQIRQPCKYYSVSVILCTLQLGMISNEVMAEIEIVLDPEQDYVLSENVYEDIELYYSDGKYAISQLTEYEENEITHLFRARIIDNGQIKTIDNIVGRPDFSYSGLHNDSMVINQGFSAIVKEDKKVFHISTSGIKTPIDMDDYPIGLYLDEDLSVSIIQSTDVTDSDTLLIYKFGKLKKIEIKNCRSIRLLNNKCGQYIFAISNDAGKILTIPKDIENSHIGDAGQPVRSNHFKVGNGTVYQHQGVYGFMKN